MSYFFLDSVLSVVLDGTRMERAGFDHRFCFVVVPLQIEENSQRKVGLGRGFKSHPVHFYLRGNYGVKSRLILTIVRQIQQQYENVQYTDSFIHMKGMNHHLTNKG